METIKEILIRRDNNTPEEADDRINDAIDIFHEYIADGDDCSAENVCEECFGLEPDYLFELIYYC